MTVKIMDCVELTVEKECYAKEGVHKRMQGVIWEEQEKDGSWLVLFPRYGEKADIADLCIEEEDLSLLPNGMDAKIKEEIEARFDGPGNKEKTQHDCPERLSDYMI